VAHLAFDSRPGEPGDACIKSGYVNGSDRWVVKVASGWPNNSSLHGRSNSQGVMLVFSMRHGGLEAVLADDGALTDKRTALAVVLCVREFAPRSFKTVLLVGTGVVARLVALELLGLEAVNERTLLIVASRTQERAVAFQEECAGLGWSFVVTAKVGPDSGMVELGPAGAQPDVVITCTPARQPVFDWKPTSSQEGDGAEPIDGVLAAKRPALIVALGADTKGKRELGPGCFQAQAAGGPAPLVVADSSAQCLGFGECASAVARGLVTPSEVVELGKALASGGSHRATEERPVIVDLTGVAVQDVTIASLVVDSAN